MTGLENSAQLQDILNQMQGTISEASKGAIEALGPHAKTLGNLSTEEVSKLFSWKYKLVQVEANEPPEVMEQALIELGADNWDCFSIIQVADKIRISCKKRPPSALGYLKHLQGLAQ